MPLKIKKKKELYPKVYRNINKPVQTWHLHLRSVAGNILFKLINKKQS